MEIIGIIIVLWILFKVFGSSSSEAPPKSPTVRTPKATTSNPPAPSQEVSAKPSVITRHNAVATNSVQTARHSPAKHQAVAQRPPVALKSDWQQFQQLIDRHRIHTLFHFTDRRNIDSIRRHGALFSWSYCDHHGINIPVPASNDLSKALDLRKGLQDFVRLSFNPSQPMMYVAQSRGVIPFVLEISPEVIYWLETQFSDINATSNGANVGPTIQDFQRINFTLAIPGNWTTPAEKAQIQAEVLVKTKIPIDFIRNI